MNSLFLIDVPYFFYQILNLQVVICLYVKINNSPFYDLRNIEILLR